MSCIENDWFMQDGARPHRTGDVFQLLEEYFGSRIIALDYPDYSGEGIEWPPYSPDLNPCDFFLWGCIKDKVYKNNPKSLAELRQNIETEIKSISTETLAAVINNFVIRLRYVISTEGKHIEHIMT